MYTHCVFVNMTCQMFSLVAYMYIMNLCVPHSRIVCVHTYIKKNKKTKKTTCTKLVGNNIPHRLTQRHKGQVG